MKKQENGLTQFIKQNAWGIIGVLAIAITFYSLTNYRLTQAEEKLSHYPSEDYFQLKFQTIDEKLDNLNDKITAHIEEE